MSGKIGKSIHLLWLLVLLAGCSHKITPPITSTWQAVPCEYRFEGDDGSILLVRARIAEFVSAKIITHTLGWTIFGDTVRYETTLYPREQRRLEGYTIFTADRCLPINSVIRSVELFIKK
jgi:hypothetical protein